MTDTTARGAGPAERARHAGEDGPAPERRRRMSARRKQGAVLRLLRGEALFEVAKNPTRPFVVDVDTLSVRAVGTAWPSMPSASQPF